MTQSAFFESTLETAPSHRFSLQQCRWSFRTSFCSLGSLISSYLHFIQNPDNILFFKDSDTKIKETAMINQTMIIGPKINLCSNLIFSFSILLLSVSVADFLPGAGTFLELSAFSMQYVKRF